MAYIYSLLDIKYAGRGSIWQMFSHLTIDPKVSGPGIGGGKEDVTGEEINSLLATATRRRDGLKGKDSHGKGHML